MISSQMTPQDFIAKWGASTRSERAASQEHFIDLYRLLGQPTPNSDPTGTHVTVSILRGSRWQRLLCTRSRQAGQAYR